MEDCIFCKIIKGQIPSKKIYEDQDIIVFHDINPVAPVHFMLVPKIHVASLLEVKEEHQAVLGKMMVMVPRLAREQGLENGFRTIINTGMIARQEVPHLHIHVIGGPNVLPGMLSRS